MASSNAKTLPRRVDLSIIIVSYNTKRITVDCLSSVFESLQGTNLNVEVIVVDNASTDGSVEELERMAANHAEIMLILNKDNTGFGKANNQAVRKAHAETILLLNSDTVVLENAISKLYNFYTENERRFPFAGGKLLNQDGTPQPSAGRFFSLPVVFAFILLMGDRWGWTRSSPDVVSQTDWVSGACIITKKHYFHELSGFDESIFMYMEEVDLLYRARKHGWKTGFTPSARFIHLGSASSNKTYPVTQAFRGLLFFYRKHHGQLSLVALKGVLQLKALVSVALGKLTHNDYLIKTYAEAYKIAAMD